MVSVLHIFPVHRIRISQTVDNGALNQKSLTHKMEPKLLTNAFLNSTSSVSDWCSILTIRFLLLTIPTFKSVRNVNNFLGLFGERSVAGVLDWLRKQNKKFEKSACSKMFSSLYRDTKRIMKKCRKKNVNLRKAQNENFAARHAFPKYFKKKIMKL